MLGMYFCLVFQNMSLGLFKLRAKNWDGLFVALEKYRSICLSRWLRPSPVWFPDVVEHGRNEDNTLISRAPFSRWL